MASMTAQPPGGVHAVEHTADLPVHVTN